MKIVNNVPNGQEYGVTLNLKVTLTALFVNVMMVSQGREDYEVFLIYIVQL